MVEIQSSPTAPIRSKRILSSMEPPEIYYRVHKKPRISAAMLGDYMAAEDDEREGIARAAKYAKTARSVTYRGARKVLAAFITSDLRDLRRLYDAIESWKTEIGNPQTSEKAKPEIEACIEAVESFISQYNALGFAGLSTSRPPHSQPKLLIEGVSVSAYLDALIHAKDGEGNKRVGGLHIQLSKGKAEGKKPETKAKRTKAGSYASVVVMKHVFDHFSHLGIPKADLCMFANVRNGRVWYAPDHNKRMLSRIDAAARALRAGWDFISEPPDFDPKYARFV